MPGNRNKRYLAGLRIRVVWMYHETRPGLCRGLAGDGQGR